MTAHYDFAVDNDVLLSILRKVNRGLPGSCLPKPLAQAMQELYPPEVLAELAAVLLECDLVELFRKSLCVELTTLPVDPPPRLFVLLNSIEEFINQRTGGTISRTEINYVLEAAMAIPRVSYLSANPG